MTALLAEYNATVAETELRMRLRAVVHAGEVHEDGRGFYGDDIDLAFRLLNSQTVKRALRQESAAPLVLVVSEEIWDKIVRHGYVDGGPYPQRVQVQVGERRRSGRVIIPADFIWERALYAVYCALEQRLDKTEELYDVETGLARLKEWTAAAASGAVYEMPTSQSLPAK